MRRGLPALALAALPLLATTIPAAADTQAVRKTALTELVPVQGAVAAPGASAVRAPLPLFDAIDRLPVAEEHRADYKVS